MQNKGAIRLFAILFALICLYQLSFTWIVRSVEKDAEEYANGDPALYQSYIDSMGPQPVFDLLVREYTYNEVKSRELNLGLDLKGGMNVILEVSVNDILRSLSNNSKDPIFNQAIDAANERQRDSQDDYITLFFQEFQRIRTEQSSDIRLADPTIFGNRDLKDKVNFDSSDEEVVRVLRSEAEGAIERAFTVLRARIDKFGVAQPNIQRLEGTGRILVELPGVKEPERVKRLLQSTAELGFYETYENQDMIPFLNAANERLKDIVERPTAAEVVETESESEVEATDDALNLDSFGIEEDTVEVVEDSIDSLGLADAGETAADSTLDPNAAFNPLFDILLPNYNFETNQAGTGPVIGFVAIKDTAKVIDYLNLKQVRDLLPAEMRYAKFLWEAKTESNSDENFMRLLAIAGSRDNEAYLQGDAIIDARQDYDELGRPSVSMSMNNQGANIWARMTGDNVGRSVAVVLDDYVYSYPNVNEEIKNGSTQIAGSFSVKEAKDLANILKAGKLPAPARIIQADVVGPSLGKEAISAGLVSFLIALGVVLIYMIFYYSTAGLVSNLALIANMFFIFGVLASVQAVLTLPGIAGIVLTIGMAVDANVLIYERIREEMTAGKGLRLAINDGYKNAFSSIIDANVTTLLTGIILFVFGTGPIRGFASTLIIGILTSLFSAIFLTRLIYERLLSQKRDIKFSTKMTEGAFKGLTIPFLQKRRMYYIISGVVIVLGLVSLFTRGLNQGVDFSGGRTYQVRFDQPVNTSEITESLSQAFVVEDGPAVRPEVKTFGGSNQVRITTKYRIDDKGVEVDQDIEAKLWTGVQSYFQGEITRDQFFNDSNDKEFGLMSSSQVGPTIADDIRTSAVWSILFSLVVIFLYILIRFRRWQFSLGAVAAVFHDVLIVLSLFSILYGFVPFSLEIDQAFIAALLTVIGYSLNDTVVVFDRIREYLNLHPKRDFDDNVNQALNSTLSRTVNTSLTTLFVLLVIFFFGGETIRGFMFALVVGVIVGTYSSVCIATPVMVDTIAKKMKS
ncbi:protein translocase subunit SecDF [Cryomorphaceae bacterium]|nr:protein translocase subunit SecDF [Cryomorphaceae bacterium]